MLFIAANSSPAPKKGSHFLIETEDDNEADFKKEVNITVIARGNENNLIQTNSWCSNHVFGGG